ncbi:MAG: hypothetical protein IT290_04325 [Deltaproteobacteria bacterium]|nr:hypothetical protein [Deltaproteobacteria bacterium]
MIINPHPPLTSFPIALALLLVAFEVWVAARRPSAAPVGEVRIFLVIALLLAVSAAYYSGFWGLEYAADPSMLRPLTEREASDHQAFARVALILSFPFALFGYLASARPQRALRTVYFVCLMGLAMTLLWTGFQGGRLVFERAAGVSKVAE